MTTSRVIEVTRRGRTGAQGNPGSTAFNAVTTAGTSTVYTLANATPIISYDDGYGVTIDAHVTNGAAPTINVDGLGAVAIKKQSGGSAVAIAAGDLVADNFYMIHYSAVESCFLLFSADIIKNVADDTTPQLGGPLDRNSHAITGGKGSDVASATNIDPPLDGNLFLITGTTDIETIDTTSNLWSTGSIITLHFESSVDLIHHATNLVLPFGVDIHTVGGDIAVLECTGAGTWELLFFSGDAYFSAKTIATGSVDYDGEKYIILDTEGAAASDDINTTTSVNKPGAIITLMAADAARVVTVKHGSTSPGYSGFRLAGGLDFVFASTLDTLTLMAVGYGPINWVEISRSVN